ncbi:MAG: hypothetical protein ABSE18_01725 [Minisyncoccia bacterium]|jgi:hypothetical protein
MDTLIHADIFFFVTTIAVVIVGAVLAVALICLVKILSDIKKITKQVHEETTLFREDLHDLRTQVRHDGFRLQHFIDFVTRLVHRKKTSRSKKG